ncbi:MAG: hypothetical protein O3B84_00625 [Chloroflexi bacterium]|nr:hypothetical protein [Chloroflexota bacterium]
MGKLVDRLQRISEGPSQPLGFMPASRQKRSAPLVLVAHLPKGSEALLPGAADSGAEFVLLETPPNASPAAGASAIPWGIRTDTLDDAEQAKLKEAGCDFVIASLEDTPIRLLANDVIDAVAMVSDGTEDRMLRAIDQLPCDAVIVGDAPGDELTVARFLEYSSIASGIGQNLLIWASARWGRVEVEQLRDVGFSALVVTVASEADLEGLRAIRDTIASLPARSKKRDDRLRARVPQFGVAASSNVDPDDDDDDDDDYDDE